MKRADFLEQIKRHKQENMSRVQADAWRNDFHIMAPIGWINDPNGLCYFKGEYHVFYQYSPLNAKGGLKFWGHYTSPDLVNWKEHEVTLFPDIAEDRDGVYSGSALIHEDEMYLLYTGNVKLKGDYDYILTGREQNVIMLKSSDGYHFSEKTVVLRNEDYPETMGLHVRDPKVWEESGVFYMVLGARSKDDKGYILLYKSTDLLNWDLVSIPAGGLTDFGYMWECPDLIKLDNQVVFIFSPQGMEPDGIKYQNVYQTGYALGTFDEGKQNLTIQAFEELDRGFDFYAPQTFKDHKNRTIMIGWAGVPDAVEHRNPTIENEWQHCLTLPRELVLKENKVYQVPVEELQVLRKDKTTIDTFKLNEQMSFDLFQSNTFELNLAIKESTQFNIDLRQDCTLTYKDGVFKLNLGKSGCGRDSRAVAIETIYDITIYSDQSILEIYLNGGQEVFTTRIYNEGHDTELTVSGNGQMTINKWEI